MKRSFYPAIILLLGIAPIAVALTVTSGTLTQSRTGNRGELERLDLNWSTEIHSGKVRATGVAIDGLVERVVVDSDVGTSVQIPAGGYTIYLRDLDGIDVLTSRTADVDTTSTQLSQWISAGDEATSVGRFIPFTGPLTFDLDDAGTTPTRVGRVRLYYRR